MGGLETLDPRYAHLYRRAAAVLDADRRVHSFAVGGSVGTGTADRWSDLDLTVVTVPEAHDEFVADWPRWLSAITPTVFARTPIAPFIVNAVTDAGLTLDFAIWPGGAPVFPPVTQYTVGALSNLRFDGIADALQYAVEEQLRGMAGPFIRFLQRDEHMHHLTGVPHLLGLLTTVFLAETGAPPPSKHWNATFTEEQRAVVAALPPVSATRVGLIDFGIAIAHTVIERARPLFERYSLDWPSALAAVTAARVHDELGLDVSDWLH